ncbi:MAG: alpha/beta hydrolase [Rickettsiales bacterium]|jgi:predicted alpha/beta hydrolase family esterase|nr:alpha/beta hydrolase [Rickettsiales bacterium]
MNREEARAIICHGVNKSHEYALEQLIPSNAKSWLPWLQQRFLLADIDCQSPNFVHSWVPDRIYNDDVKVFSRLEINKETSLIGHSCGGGFLLKYLSEHPEIEIKHLVLVAPWIDPDRLLNNYYTNLELDKSLPDRVGQIDLFVSSDDMDMVLRSVAKIKEIYGDKIIYHEFNDKGHFTESDMGTKEFPELWEVCKSQI